MSKTILKTFIFFSVVLFICFGVYKLLKGGIYFPHISLGSVEINEFYLVLDKKLNIYIQKITLEEQQQDIQHFKNIEEEMQFVLRIVKNIKMFLNIIGEVDIRAIVVDDFVGTLSLKDRVIVGRLPHWRLEIALYDDTDLQHLQIHISELTYTPLQLSIMGLVDYDFNQNVANFYTLSSLGEDFKFYSTIATDFKSISVEGFSETIKTLDFLKPILPDLEPEAQEWLFKRIKGDFILSKVIFKSEINKNAIIKALKDNLFIDMKIAQGAVLYNNALPPAVFKEANIIYHKGESYAVLVEPMYDNISLAGSNVLLKNLFENPILEINIATYTRLDKRAMKVLEAYNIFLPLEQKSSGVDINLTLSIPFGKEGFDVSGRFVIKNSRLSLSGLPIHVDFAEIFLKNDKIIFDDVPIRIQGAIVADARLSLLVDTKAKTLEGIANLKYFNIQPEQGILQITHYPLAIVADFKDDFQLNLPSLEVSLSIGNQSIINISNLALLYPYSSLLKEYGISQGSLTLSTKDFKNIALKAYVQEHNIPVKRIDGSSFKPLQINGNIHADNNFNLYIENLIQIFSQKNSININAQQVLYDLDSVELGGTQQKDNKEKMPINIQGKDLAIQMKNKKIFAENVSLKFDKWHNIQGTVKNKNTDLNITYRHKILTLYGNRITSRIINDFLGIDALDGGIYTLLAEYKQGVFKGNIVLKKSTIKNLYGIQNVIAFIDTVPSLLIFKNPGFDRNGYKVESGSIDIEISDGFLKVEQFQLDGISIDSYGAGIVRLDDGAIEFNMKITTFKALSTLLNNIPIAGYIITGDDGSFSTFIKITGTINKPYISTDLASQTIRTPATLIERIIKIPLKLMSQ